MRDLIDNLIEASGPERLTKTPHVCPVGWKQVKVRKGGKLFWTCKRPSAMDDAKLGLDSLQMAWEAVQLGRWSRAYDALGLVLSNPKTRPTGKRRSDIMTIQSIINFEMDGGGDGKRRTVNTVKPLFKRLGVRVSGRQSR